MTEQSAAKEPREIALGDAFGPAAIQVNGVSVSVDPDGNVVVVTAGNIEARTTKGSVVAYTDSLQINTTATVTQKSYEIGDVLPDGWIFLGNSPKTGKAYSLEPVKGAVEGVVTWYEGEEHAVSLNARLPSDEEEGRESSELRDVFNKIVKGGHNDVARLDTSGSYPDGRYWSSAPGPEISDHARVRYFGDSTDLRDWGDKRNLARVRCVRDEPQLVAACPS